MRVAVTLLPNVAALGVADAIQGVQVAFQRGNLTWAQETEREGAVE